MRPNWFLAFPLDGSFVLDLPPPPTWFRLFHPDDVHMTLAFLGACGEESAHRALAALDDSLRESPLPPFEISLGDVVPMGSARRYTALSALLEVGRETATACIQSRRDVLTRAANGKLESRPAKPHVTFARPRSRATDEARALGIEWARALNLGPTRRTLDRIALYTWSDAPRGVRGGSLPEFRIVAERSL